MKLIYYGLFDRQSDCENWICNALSRAGILVYRWQKRMGSVNTHWLNFIQYVLDEKIDVVLITKAYEISTHELTLLKQKTGCKLVFWTFDWMLNPQVKDMYFPQAQLADICFQTDGVDVNNDYVANRIKRVELHQGIDKDTHYEHTEPLTDAEHAKYACDVAFFGSLYTNKRKLMHQILTDKYGKRYKVWGNGGFEKGLWNEEFRKAISVSKIIIGDNFVCDVPGYWSDRVYLTLGCGGFFITSNVPFLELKFKIGTHLDVWNNFNNLTDKIDYYLAHKEERDRIRKEGMKFVQENHTYDIRVKEMLAKIRELK